MRNMSRTNDDHMTVSRCRPLPAELQASRGFSDRARSGKHPCSSLFIVLRPIFFEMFTSKACVSAESVVSVEEVPGGEEQRSGVNNEVAGSRPGMFSATTRPYR